MSRFIFKVLVVGDEGVGKTSLLHRSADGFFSEDYRSVVGATFAVQTIKLDGSPIKLQFWNIADQPRFNIVRREFFRGSSGVVYVFSITDRPSFDHIPTWADEVQEVLGEIPSLLVANKIDLAKKRVVTTKEAKALAKRLGFAYAKTSATKGPSMTKALHNLIVSILQTKWPQMTTNHLIPPTPPPKPSRLQHLRAWLRLHKPRRPRWRAKWPIENSDDSDD